MLCDPDVCRQAQRAAFRRPAALPKFRSSNVSPPIVPPCGSASIAAPATCASVGWPGSYAPVLQKLLNQPPVDTFLLEYDSERASDFAIAVPAQAQDGRAWPRFLQECSPGR